MRALFLDRDGVINHRIVGGYVRNQHEFILHSEIVPLLRNARQLGYLLILISNQQGVGKGLMTEADLGGLHASMRAALAAEGVVLAGIFACPDAELHAQPHLVLRLRKRRGALPGRGVHLLLDHAEPSFQWPGGRLLQPVSAL